MCPGNQFIIIFLLLCLLLLIFRLIIAQNQNLDNIIELVVDKFILGDIMLLLVGDIMQEINNTRLVNFQPGCEAHEIVLSKNQNYQFYKNFELIKKFLIKMEFTGGLDVDEDDFKLYVTQNTLLIGIDIYNIDNDEFRYLFDAFNVYLAMDGESTYDKSTRLTQEWRKTMKNEYPDPSYVADLKKNLNIERQELIEQVNKNIDEQISELKGL
jgi:hypothetical protein